MSDHEIEVLLSGPMGQRASAITALRQAGVRDDKFCHADHGFAPEHREPDEAWLAYRADDLSACDALARTGWRLRLHRHVVPKLRLGEPPAPLGAPDPLGEMRAEIARLSAEVQSLQAGRP